MAQKSYSRLTIQEREILHKGLAQGKKQNQIAVELNRHPSSISREIRRDGMTCNSYKPSRAQHDAENQGKRRGRRSKLNQGTPLTDLVEAGLKKRWSPEQISGVLSKTSPTDETFKVSHETIYRYIYGLQNTTHRKELIKCLRQGRRRRQRHKRGNFRASRIRNLISIRERPKNVEDREEPGHWEGDLIIGKDQKSAIGTIVERTTRFSIILPFYERPNTIQVVNAFAAALAVLPPHMKRSLTYDRGSEMSGHQRFTGLTGINVFFADPYSPWQRGSNENTNGLIRDYLPKKTDFREIDDYALYSIQVALNARPRKVLNYWEPDIMFNWLKERPQSTASAFYQAMYESAI